MIYQILNPTNYVCPDQATIDQGQAYGYVGIFSIGTSTEADAILATNRNTWLAQNIALFTVNKDIDPDPVQTTWIVCDLDTEQPNTDVDYNVFNVVNGYYTSATGLDNAKVLLEQTKQSWLTAQGMSQYYEFEAFIKPPSVSEPNQPQPVATGVQTL